MIVTDALYAPAAIRDQFLRALDARDRTESTRLALNLIGCMNPLPGMTCGELGLPTGSTYGSAARRVLVLDSDPDSSKFTDPGGAREEDGDASAATQ